MEDLERKLDQLLKEPTNPNLFKEVGVILYQVKDLENAEKYFKRAYQINTQDSDTIYNYASLLYQRGQFDKAIDIYKAYLEICIDDKEVMESIMDCYYQLGEYKLAGKMYERIKKSREGNL